MLVRQGEVVGKCFCEALSISAPRVYALSLLTAHMARYAPPVGVVAQHVYDSLLFLGECQVLGTLGGTLDQWGAGMQTAHRFIVVIIHARG